MTHTKINLKSIEDKELHGILSCTCFHISVSQDKKTKDSDNKSPLMAQQIKQKSPVVLNVACAAIN